MQNSKKKIAIIGGGIAGLTFARCLPIDEYDVHIFEKKSEFGEVGAAISIFPNALCVMDEIGLLSDILASSGQITNVYIKTDKGNILSETTPKSDYPVTCIHRADLHGILLRDVPATLHTGHGLSEIKQPSDDRVQLVFDNGESILADAVVGADGINSVVREHIIGDGGPIYRGYNVWRGVIETDFDIGYGSETYGAGKRVGVVPIKDGVYGWWATCNEPYKQDDEPEGTRAKLMRLFGDWHDPIPDLIANTDVILKHGLSDRRPHKGWTKGNITLIGDAAHATTPNLGQGGCISIEGAYLLAKCISKYGLTPKAYATYERHQYPRSKTVISESLQMGRVGQISNPILIAIRNFLLKITPSTLTLKVIDKYFSYRVTEVEV